VFDAGRYDDAMGILDWLWSSDNVHAFARVAGLRAMSVVYRAKGDNDAAENCERWAQTLAPRKQQ
jgi:alpha-galactosidase